MENNQPQKRLRIAIEAQRIFRPRKHGMDVVALEMIRELQKLDTVNEYFILTKEDEDICLQETPNFKIIFLKGKSYPDWEQVALPGWLRRYRPDILHCTSNTAPLRGKCRLFLTLHDIIFLEKNYLLSKKGGSSYQRFGNFYRRFIAPRAAQKAEVIFTVSNYQREVISKRLKLPADKIQVVYNGVSPAFFERSDALTRQEIQEYYQLPQRYLFFLGNKEPRKNLTGVLKAYALELASFPMATPTLVIKGIEEEYLYKTLNELKLPHLYPSIKLIGYIKSEHLPTIYQMAEMLLFPSFSEGFGIPIIEAMASGIPVITSNVTSMPEVAGDAALLVSPSAPEELAAAIRKLLSDDGLRQSLVEKGKERAQPFTWERLAKTIFNSYLAIK